MSYPSPLADLKDSPYLFDVFEKRKEGGITYTRQVIIDEQRSILWGFFQKVGMQLLSGNSIMSISLPVKLSEPKSMLEKIAQEFVYAPAYLTVAAALCDPVERMKNVITFVIAGLHQTILCQKKPFNPILGETFQAEFADGTLIFLEQTSHHPPVSHWEVLGPSKCYKLCGYGQPHVSINGGNSIMCHRSGKNKIEFADGSVIEYTMPQLIMHGLMWGVRSIEYKGELEFIDAKNSLLGKLKLDSESTTKSWFGGLYGGVTDIFKGTIERVEKEQSLGEIVVFINGSWIDKIQFNGEVLWTVSERNDCKLLRPKEILPSDSRLRPDLSALATDNDEMAQTLKELLEKAQRADAKLRKNCITGSEPSSNFDTDQLRKLSATIL